MIVTIEYNQVVVEDRQNKNVEHCVHIFTRQEFENIIGCSLSDYESASYEPNRNIFITTNRDNVIESYKSANENEILKAIEDKKDLIIFETEKALLQNKIFENGVWIDKPKSKEELEQEEIEEAKRAKQLHLDTIIVTVNGNEFDGNDKARLNMLSAIQSAEVIGIDKKYWKLADNTVAEVTVSELKQALAKAIQRVGEIVV